MAATERIANHDFIRVPADSAGKRSGTHTHIIITYKNGTIDFPLDALVVGQTSTTIGEIVSKRGTTTVGELVIVLSPDSTTFDYTADENLLVGGVTYAQVNGTTVVHNQSAIIVGGNNPYNSQFVDDQGAAYVRYTEGEQQLDGAGLTRTTTPTQISQHVFNYDILPENYMDTVSGVASTIVHNSGAQCVVMTNDIASGSITRRKTNRYYPSQYGFGTVIEIALCVGDAGVPGCVRRWGLFDDQDGVFFEVSGSNFYVGHRTSTENLGTITEEKIAQADFNTDTVDGADGLDNLSKVALNFATFNTYWIDFVFTGTARIRYGMYGPRGQRIVFHTMQETNEYVWPFVRQGNFPFQIEQICETGLGTPPQLKYSTMVLMIDGDIATSIDKHSHHRSYGISTLVSCSSTTSTPLMSFRSATSYQGQTNRSISVPHGFGAYVKTAPVVFELYRSSSLSGSVPFTQPETSALEFQLTSSLISGRKHSSWMADIGTFNTDFPSQISYLGNNLITKADASPGEIWTLAAKSLEPGTSASVLVDLNWTDFR